MVECLARWECEQQLQLVLMKETSLWKSSVHKTRLSISIFWVICNDQWYFYVWPAKGIEPTLLESPIQHLNRSAMCTLCKGKEGDWLHAAMLKYFCIKVQLNFKCILGIMQGASFYVWFKYDLGQKYHAVSWGLRDLMLCQRCIISILLPSPLFTWTQIMQNVNVYDRSCFTSRMH